ncbi:endonuclease/exonuclease/phosphatase family protein [Candidatus Mycolicibacterium alkanivorans]|uniref:Endonuclease/exonuclease/phosphatase family protein n=1 Tax=Candidatus Mycolicibacterium alkanivorans TaxID=2954114 RepID=A0ABS9YQA5_9MYCO|nr:endonuclease/exonuclease/phosphatase family protein [Candidatus Mycolicibacterium alkanivorans]MCI4673465.1 endonuclease/exonuclease/phosphatase family protein [Candidatus Mycolicibacterium alkanivorans]
MRGLLLRTSAYIVAILGMLLTATALIARLIPITNHVVLGVAALSPYLTAGAATAAVLLLVTRRWITGAAAAALTALAIAVQLPLFTGANSSNGATVRVFTANVRMGEADPKALLDIANQNADVVVLEELTAELADALDQTGINNAFRYQTLEPGENGSGVGIWSRFPITLSKRIGGYRLGMLSAYISVPGTQRDAVFVATHLAGPWPQDIEPWREEIHSLPATLNTVKEQAYGRPVIVAGDFNATYDMAPFRDLLTNGFADAAEQSGAGITRTFPADEKLPPLLGIDHVLTYNATATDVQTVRVPGSDHLGLLATIGLTPLRGSSG